MANQEHWVAEGLKGPAQLAGRALLASQGRERRGTREIGPDWGRAREVAGGRRESRRFANGVPDPDRGNLHAACRHEGFHSGSTRYDRRSGVLRFVLLCEDCGAEMREVRRVAYSPQYEPRQARPLAA